MSGISSRLINDSCAISQQTKTSCGPAEYSLFLDYHINPSFKGPKDIPCATQTKTVGCAPCDLNSNATVSLGPQSFVQLADIEDNLRGIKRNLTVCSNAKFVLNNFAQAVCLINFELGSIQLYNNILFSSSK